MSYPTCDIMKFQVLTGALLKIQIFLGSYTMSLGKQFPVFHRITGNYLPNDTV